MYLSVDPAMRSWMSGPVALGEVIRCGGMARVLQSRSAAFQQGELVQARLGWQTHPTLPAMYLQEVDEKRGDALAWIGPLGLSAVTAYFGMRDIGTVKPGDRFGTQSRLDVPIKSTVLATPMPVTPGSSWI
jgi:NADPH-dependent curcumin reductase